MSMKATHCVQCSCRRNDDHMWHPNLLFSRIAFGSSENPPGVPLLGKPAAVLLDPETVFNKRRARWPRDALSVYAILNLAATETQPEARYTYITGIFKFPFCRSEIDEQGEINRPKNSKHASIHVNIRPVRFRSFIAVVGAQGRRV
jgi:hypothetical protein